MTYQAKSSETEEQKIVIRWARVMQTGAYHGCRIELKHGANKPSAHQIEWLTRMQDAGYFTAICYESDAAIRVLQKYLRLQDGQEMRFDLRRKEKYGVPVF